MCWRKVGCGKRPGASHSSSRHAVEGLVNRLFGSFRAGLCAILFVGIASNAVAFFANTARLPTPQVPYQLVNPPVDFNGGQFTIYNFEVQAPDPADVEYPVIDFVNDKWTLDSFFDVTYQMQLSIGLAPTILVFGEGQMRIVGEADGEDDAITLHYNLELVQLDLFPAATGDPLFPIYLRESPTLASTGVTTTENLCLFCGSMQYNVSSFFDVFAEISLDGNNWTPSTGSFRIVQGIPEPSTWLLVAPAVLLVRRIRCRA
jgi:hypothetical protein